MISYERQMRHLNKLSTSNHATHTTCVVCKMITERQHRLRRAAYRAHKE